MTNFLWLVGFILSLFLVVQILSAISRSAKFRQRSKTLTPLAAQQMKEWANESDRAKALGQYLESKRFKAFELTVYNTGYPLVDFCEMYMPMTCYLPDLERMSEPDLDEYLAMLETVPDEVRASNHLSAASNDRFWTKYVSMIARYDLHHQLSRLGE